MLIILFLVVYFIQCPQWFFCLSFASLRFILFRQIRDNSCNSWICLFYCFFTLHASRLSSLFLVFSVVYFFLFCFTLHVFYLFFQCLQWFIFLSLEIGYWSFIFPFASPGQARGMLCACPCLPAGRRLRRGSFIFPCINPSNQFNPRFIFFLFRFTRYASRPLSLYSVSSVVF